MSTLDNSNMIDPATVPYAKKAFNQGIIATLALIVAELLFSLTGLVQPGQRGGIVWLFYLANGTILTYFLYTTVKGHKMEELGGYISFGRAFSVGGVLILTVMFILSIWAFINASFIIPDSGDMMREAMADEFVNRQKMTEKQAEEMLDGAIMQFVMSPAGIALSIALMTAFFGVIIDLIVAAVVKEDNPAFE